MSSRNCSFRITEVDNGWTGEVIEPSQTYLKMWVAPTFDGICDHVRAWWETQRPISCDHRTWGENQPCIKCGLRVITLQFGSTAAKGGGQ